MKILNAILAMSVIALFPISASAQGFNNININLNDAMMQQRNQEMAARLDQANRDGVFTAKKHHEKHNKNHKMALLQGEISITDNGAAGPVNNADAAGAAAGAPVSKP